MSCTEVKYNQIKQHFITYTTKKYAVAKTTQFNPNIIFYKNRIKGSKSAKLGMKLMAVDSYNDKDNQR